MFIHYVLEYNQNWCFALVFFGPPVNVCLYFACIATPAADNSLVQLYKCRELHNPRMKNFL